MVLKPAFEIVAAGSRIIKLELKKAHKEKRTSGEINPPEVKFAESSLG